MPPSVELRYVWGSAPTTVIDKLDGSEISNIFCPASPRALSRGKASLCFFSLNETKFIGTRHGWSPLVDNNKNQFELTLGKNMELSKKKRIQSKNEILNNFN